MEKLDSAIIFATSAHSGQRRKMTGTPYIFHPIEVAQIISSITDNEDVMVAGVLHDTIEDCGVTRDEIESRFGNYVLFLVETETEDKKRDINPELSWITRKEDSLVVLENATDRNVGILWLADKLSNIRSLYNGYLQKGNKIWQCFHQKDPNMHKWYYESIAERLSYLSDTDAYKEYVTIVSNMFGGK